MPIETVSDYCGVSASEAVRRDRKHRPRFFGAAGRKCDRMIHFDTAKHFFCKADGSINPREA